MKDYADHKTRAKSPDIKEGDIVLVRQPKLNKMSTKYNPTPFQVTRRQGNRVNETFHF